MQSLIGHEEMKTLPKILAVDFDGLIVSDCFPNIGEAHLDVVNTIKKLKSIGVKVILWSCRDNDTDDRHLDAAVKYCAEELGLTFDAVNENIAETKAMFNNDTRKVYADLYWDDKGIPDIQSPLYWSYRLGVSYNDLRE